jgi:hypothetical protein
MATDVLIVGSAHSTISSMQLDNNFSMVRSSALRLAVCCKKKNPPPSHGKNGRFQDLEADLRVLPTLKGGRSP